MWEMFTGSKIGSTLSFGPTLAVRCADEHCSLNTDNENYELVIKSVVLGDGGRYRCKVQSGTIGQLNKDAEVITFGKVHFKTLKLMYHRNDICVHCCRTFARFQSSSLLKQICFSKAELESFVELYSFPLSCM